MLEQAFAARFSGTHAAPGHPLAAAHQAEAAVPLAPGTIAGAQPGSADAKQQQQQQQPVVPVHPDVPEPEGTLAPAAAPEPGKPSDPDAPASGLIPSGGPMAPAADLVPSTAFADPTSQLAEQAQPNGGHHPHGASQAAG